MDVTEDQLPVASLEAALMQLRGSGHGLIDQDKRLRRRFDPTALKVSEERRAAMSDEGDPLAVERTVLAGGNASYDELHPVTQQGTLGVEVEEVGVFGHGSWFSGGS